MCLHQRAENIRLLSAQLNAAIAEAANKGLETDGVMVPSFVPERRGPVGFVLYVDIHRINADGSKEKI